MSGIIEGKANALTVVLVDYINAIVLGAMEANSRGERGGGKAGKTNKAAPNKKADKKDLAEKKKAAKLVAAKALKELGKKVLAELLKAAGVKTFPELKDEDALEKFMESVKERLEKKTDDDDLLGGDPADAPEERTLDDVKAKLLEINNHEKLGKEVTKEILGELGVRRLPEMSPEKYGEAYAAAEKALKDA